MFLALIVFQLAVAAANPFHKYPYVFLLDIGNEELKKTNTEQLRLSSPGGSLALRYPAVGDGDTISHIRVSGIDFGTDLKANIIDGGPGYKYVVLVFMGNQGVPYDAVMTVQTVSDEDIGDDQNRDAIGNNYYKTYEDNNDSAEVVDDNSIDADQSSFDKNVSSEDTSDEVNAKNIAKFNAQITQPSSNVYTYANVAADYENADDDTTNEKDIHNQYQESDFDEHENGDVNSDVNDQDDVSNDPEPSNFDENDYENDVDADENESFSSTDNRAYNKYQSVMPLRIYDGVRLYPQYAVPFALSKSDSVYSPDVAVDSDHNTFNNDNDRSDFDKYKDSNNNYDSNGASAIA